MTREQSIRIDLDQQIKTTRLRCNTRKQPQTKGDDAVSTYLVKLGRGRESTLDRFATDREPDLKMLARDFQTLQKQTP